MKNEKMHDPISAGVLGALARVRNTVMQVKTIKSVIVCSACAGIIIATANAQPNVTWQSPITISGTSDVSTLGTYFGSWAPHDGGANNYPVNGVTFRDFSIFPVSHRAQLLIMAITVSVRPILPTTTTIRFFNSRVFPTKDPLPRLSAGLA